MLAFRYGHDRTIGSMLAQSHTRQDRSEDDDDRDSAVNQAATHATKVREIVVGIDESDASRLALIYAVEEAVAGRPRLGS